jgi:hypothetical protein
MLVQLKKQAITSTIKRILICAAITLISLLISYDSLTKFIEGPKDLYALDVKDLPKTYVTGDINAILGNFAEYYEENEDGTENVTNNYYIIPVGESEYIGLEVSKSDFGIADQILEETMNYIDGTQDELTTALNVTGTVNPMESEVLQYYQDWFKSSGYSEEEIKNLALPYMLQINYVGSVDTGTAYAFLALAAVCIILILVLIINLLTGSHLSKIRKYLKQNESSMSMEKIEADYENASDAGPVKIGSLFTYYFQGNKAWIIRNEDIIWAYEQEVTHKTNGIKVGVSKNLLIYTRDKKKHTIRLKKKDDVSPILSQLSQNEHIITGYSDKLLKCFEKDFDAFLNLSYSSETASTEQDINQTDSF